MRGKDIHVEAIEADMYAAIDVLVDKLDRQVVKHKEKRAEHRHEGAAIKRDVAAAERRPRLPSPARVCQRLGPRLLVTRRAAYDRAGGAAGAPSVRPDDRTSSRGQRQVPSR